MDGMTEADDEPTNRNAYLPTEVDPVRVRLREGTVYATEIAAAAEAKGIDLADVYEGRTATHVKLTTNDEAAALAEAANWALTLGTSSLPANVRSGVDRVFDEAGLAWYAARYESVIHDRPDGKAPDPMDRDVDDYTGREHLDAATDGDVDRGDGPITDGGARTARPDGGGYCHVCGDGTRLHVWSFADDDVLCDTCATSLAWAAYRGSDAETTAARREVLQ